MMDKFTDIFLSKLFELAEHVLGKSSTTYHMPRHEPKAEMPVPTIRFSRDDRMVEGELFK